MTKTRMSGFQKPIDDGSRKAVGLAKIRYSKETGITSCSCGQPFTQRRAKVREDAIDRHIAKKHKGKGIRL